MDSAREKLTAASHKLAEQMYKATQATPGAAPGGAAPGDGHAAAVMARARRRTKA